MCIIIIIIIIIIVVVFGAATLLHSALTNVADHSLFPVVLASVITFSLLFVVLSQFFSYVVIVFAFRWQSEGGGCKGCWWETRREGDLWGDLGVDGWIILGWISRRWDVGIWTGLDWPRIETGGGRL